MDYQKLAQSIERNRCPRHNEKPIVTPTDNTIQLHCCCVRFEEELRLKIITEKEIQNLENIHTFLHGKKA